jgi:hypothetical protein
MPMLNEKTIQKHMNVLHISREEAIELIKEDEKIDKMTSTSEINSDMSVEQVKAAKTARQADRKKTVFNFDVSKREKKANPDKRILIENLRASVQAVGSTDIEVTNPEREMVFKFNNVKYKIVLSAPRS